MCGLQAEEILADKTVPERTGDRHPGRGRIYPMNIGGVGPLHGNRALWTPRFTSVHDVVDLCAVGDGSLNRFSEVDSVLSLGEIEDVTDECFPVYSKH